MKTATGTLLSAFFQHLVQNLTFYHLLPLEVKNCGADRLHERCEAAGFSQIEKKSLLICQ